MPALKTAAWADPHSIEVAVGQRQHQIAELMADTRARHAESQVARVAAENVNRALIEAAKTAALEGPKPTGEGYSLEELNGADISQASSRALESEEAFSLAELNAV